MSVFFNTQHELRSGWKVLIYLLVLIVSFVVGGLLISVFATSRLFPEDEIALLGIGVLIQLFASICALAFMARFVDRVPISTFGLGLSGKWRREFTAGVLIAVVMLVIVTLCSMLFGDLSIQRNVTSTAGAILLMVFVLLGAAAFEELVFRGYPMQTLMKAVGTWPAALFMSILFGLVHMGNPNASPLGIINTVLAGLLLSLGYVETRRLWLPYGLHFAWNAGLGLVLGFSLSGITTASLWTTTVKGQDILLGGNYGPEGGIAGTITFVAGMGFFITRWMNRNHNQETQ